MRIAFASSFLVAAAYAGNADFASLFRKPAQARQLDTLADGQGWQLYHEDFDKLIDEDVDTSVPSYGFLHLHGKDGVGEYAKMQRKFNVPTFAEKVDIEFMFYEIGDWERSGSYQDYVKCTVGGTTFDLGTFARSSNHLDDYVTGEANGITFTRRGFCGVGHFAEASGVGKEGQMHKITISVPRAHFTSGSLEFTIHLDVSADKNSESAGVDDFRVTAYGGDTCGLPEEPREPFDPDTPTIPDTLPVACDAKTAISWGDPHLITFDNKKYDCMGEGEFTLLKTLHSDEFEIQARYTSFKTDPSVYSTVTRSLVIKEKDMPTIQLTTPYNFKQECPVDLFVDGVEKSDILNQALYVGATNLNADDSVIIRRLVDNSRIGKGDRFYDSVEKVVIYYPSTGLQLIVERAQSTTYGCFLSLKLCMPNSYRQFEKMVGLLGSPDGSSGNDWMTASGETLPFSSNRQKGYEYCSANWCVTDETDSLFTYTDGETFVDHRHCGKVYNDKFDSCVENPPSGATDICGTEEQCIAEYCGAFVNGDAASAEAGAKASLEAEVRMNVEKGCGQTLVYEDFTGANDWGMTGNYQDQCDQDFLGPFHSQSATVTKTFPVPYFTEYLSIDFLLYEFGNWGSTSLDASNAFFVKIGDTELYLASFEDGDKGFGAESERLGATNGISWTRKPVVAVSGHKLTTKVSVAVPKEHLKSGSVEITFGAKMVESIDTISAGVDELRLTAHPLKCGAMFRCTPDCPAGMEPNPAYDPDLPESNDCVCPDGMLETPAGDGCVCPEGEMIDDVTGGCVPIPTTTTTTPDDVMTTASPPGTKGDPHFKTHGGEMFDFHGGCDLVLLDNPSFKNGLGLTIHIRTKIETWWSYVESAVIKIGDEILEITGADQEEWLWKNGEADTGLVLGEWKESKFAGHVLRLKKAIGQTERREAHIYFGKGEKIMFKTFNNFLKVDFVNESATTLGGSKGLLGTFPEGKRVARDGETFIEDVNTYGQEWQVTAEEPKLFHSYSDSWVVPAGQKCAMPEETEAKVQLRQRRLENGMPMEQAEKACSHLKDASDHKACVFDVIATQDESMAAVW